MQRRHLALGRFDAINGVPARIGIFYMLLSEKLTNQLISEKII